MATRTLLAIFLSVSFLSTFACTKKSDIDTPTPPKGLAGSNNGQAAIVPLDAKSQTTTNARIRGKVLEAIERKGFSYVKLEKAPGESMWIALVNTKVKVGETISVITQLEFKDFKSKNLDGKTFKKLTFASIVKDTPK